MKTGKKLIFSKIPEMSFICDSLKKVILFFTGGDKVIDVIDVARQADSKMKLHNYIKYFTNPDRPKVLNVISLEFSDTK